MSRPATHPQCDTGQKYSLQMPIGPQRPVSLRRKALHYSAHTPRIHPGVMRSASQPGHGAIAHRLNAGMNWYGGAWRVLVKSLFTFPPVEGRPAPTFNGPCGVPPASSLRRQERAGDLCLHGRLWLRD
jgi:hypothetical protein